MEDWQLDEYFSDCGEVIKAFILKDRETGKSTGRGFVEFLSRRSA